MENYDDHPLMRYEIIDKVTGKSLEIDTTALRDAISFMSYVSNECLYECLIEPADNLSNISDNIHVNNRNISSLRNSINTFVQMLEKCLPDIPPIIDDDYPF